MAPTACPKCNSQNVSIIKNNSVLNPLKGSATINLVKINFI